MTPVTVLARALLGAALSLVLAAAAAALTPDEVKARFQERYPEVTVLKVRPVEGPDGQPAYAVTVMNEGGDYNTAFQVNTVLIDRETADLIPVFGHDASRVRYGDILGRSAARTEEFGEAARSRSLSPPPGRP